MNMKFIRKARRIQIRDRALDLLSKALLIGISVLACLWMVSGAHAAPNSITEIKTTPQADSSFAIDFTLAQPISKEKVSVEFERNFIQISLKGVSAYPARTENINQSVLQKVFTYQYQPDLARARVLLKTAASSIKQKSTWTLTDSGIRVIVSSVGAVAATDTLKSKASAIDASNPIQTDTDEERIVQEILNESKGGAKVSASTYLKPSEETPIFQENKKAPEASPISSGSEEQALFSPKAEVSKPKETTATRIIASLLLVIGLIGATAVGYRRFALGKGMPFQRQAKLIEVIASQGLGPKRSIAIVKVLDQFMVVGMSGDGMSLLANLGSDVKVDKFIDQISGPAGTSFSDTFESALSAGAPNTDVAGPPITTHKAKIDLGIRSTIKKRMEGFKPL